MATKENQSIAGYEAHVGRLTRSRAAALRGSLPPVPPVQFNKPAPKTRNSFSDENAQINTSSNLGLQGKLTKLGSVENSQIGVSQLKWKKMGSDENSQIGVPKGNSKKLGSEENSQIGVLKGNLKKLGSDQNAQIGAQKGKSTRLALAEISNNIGVSLKLKKPDIGDGADKGKGKRLALDEGKNLGFQNKKRCVTNEIADVFCDGVFKRSFPVPKAQTKVFPRGKLGICKANQENKKGPNASLNLSISHNHSLVRVQTEFENAEERQLNGSGSKELNPLENVERDKDNVVILEDSPWLMINNDSKQEGEASSSRIVNIDGEKSNTLLCTVYAPQIYNNLCATELVRRPCANFMETLQRDITQSMRGILIDWLVEVCDEYRLVPDTLYLTVYLIDRYLSLSYIERQKLQLLGITCMLIASKYEEICAPRVEEFCMITDNTYDKSLVLKMENQVLSQLSYQISVPTVKTFLRRFLRAAQASSTEAPSALMHLTNYLAELTLVEYGFVKYLPSMIAASAVFLARWTLDQSNNPWNETLEHYTCYKSADLKASIVALRELQLTTQNCSLKAVREKYKHENFESVANLKSAELVESLFC